MAMKKHLKTLIILKKYGFKTYGKRGSNNEELLIRKQIPIA